jgi:S-adenosylmethionine-diacylglycerol 3-amino-3-carboxypropyl transferase
MSEKYFDALNYTLGNEDPIVELEILPENVRHIMAIAGSGSRIIPLLSKNPLQLTCVDQSFYQLALTELRIASLKFLDYKSFLSFWGYPSYQMTPYQREIIFKNLEISKQAREFLEMIFKKNNWHSILYFGKWERTFKKLSKIIRLAMGKHSLQIFYCQTKEEQKNYLETKFPYRILPFLIFVLGNSLIFNLLLYKGSFPKKNIKNSFYGFYKERLYKLMKQDVVRKNYFLQLIFLGNLKYSDGLPLECDSTIFLKSKKALQRTKVVYICDDILKAANNTPLPIDFLSLSDVPSYFKPPQEQNFLQEFKKNLSQNGIVVSRYYLHISENIDITGYKDITDNFKDIIEKEKTQMYFFGIYQKI